MKRVLGFIFVCLLALSYWKIDSRQSDTSRMEDPRDVVAPGKGISTARLNGIPIAVYTYRPAKCEISGLLLVFHGRNRKAESLRDKAIPIGIEACLIVMAPWFDQDRFPNWRYQRAGVYRKGRIQSRDNWTGPLLNELIRWAKARSGKEDLPYFLFGHSAGGQLLSRVSAYTPPDGSKRIVVANPSMYVVPDMEESAPNGFAGIFSDALAAQFLKTYLALPITIYVGSEDTRSKHLVTNKAAMRQGSNRLERARNVYAMARDLARKNEWQFGWTYVEAAGVGHSSGGMLKAPEMSQALGF